MKNRYVTPPYRSTYNRCILGDVLSIIVDAVLLVGVCAGVMAVWSVML